MQAEARHIPLKDESAQCVVTSPPYWGLRDYGVAGQIGLEKTPSEYVEKIVEVFREVRRVLRDDGTLWLNLGDCYNAYNGGSGPASKIDHPLNERNLQKPNVESGYGLRCKGLKPKDLVGIPWAVAFALRGDGWYLRSDIIWSKPNPMPESVTDRPTKAHEYIFLLSKSERYYFDQDAVREPCTYGHEIQWDPGTDGLGGDDRRTGKSTRRFSKSGNKERKLDVPTRPFDHRGSSVPFEGVYRNVRSVWNIATQPFSEAHFATFPEQLAQRCIKAGSKPGDTVLDPFAGAGTTALVADKLNRMGIACELKLEYCQMSNRRCYDDAPLFADQ